MMQSHHGNCEMTYTRRASQAVAGYLGSVSQRGINSSLRQRTQMRQVDEDYITDSFNLYGLKNKVNCYTDAMKMILSTDSPDSDDLNDQSFLEVYQAAMDLYGLIHARFILSQRGLSLMKEKYLLGVFGYCSRVMCERQIVLPIGMSEELSTSRVKVYCPKCQEVYIPRQKHLDIDGAYFGTSFPHIFLQTFQELVPPQGAGYYVPRIYGFRIYQQKGSKYYKEEGETQSHSDKDSRKGVNENQHNF